MDMANFCKHCGAKLDPDAKFCPNCGQPAAATATDRQRNSRKRSISLLNLFLAGVLLVESLLVCFWHPGILKQKETPVLIDQEDSVVPELKEDDLAAVRMSAEPTGMSSIRFDPAAVQPETVTVSGENSSVHFDSGVSLNFGDFCLYDETHQVEVRSLGTQSDEEFDAVALTCFWTGSRPNSTVWCRSRCPVIPRGATMCSSSIGMSRRAIGRSSMPSPMVRVR